MEEQPNSSNQSREPRILKMFISKNLSFVQDDDYSDYNDASIGERRNYIRNSYRAVIEDELEKKIRFHREIEDKIISDPQLKQNLEIFPRTEADTKFSSISAVLCTRALLSQGRLHEVAKKKAELDMNDDFVELLLKYNPLHTPPKRRILLMPNLTFNTLDVIPVYSDIPNEGIYSVQIPDSLLFDYTDENFVDGSKEKDLARAVKMAKEEENMIRCDCCSKKDENENVVPCYNNPDCRCFGVNNAMQKLQVDKTKKTEFRTFEPIYMTGTEAMYGKYYGFACSELCGCKGNCTNNSMLIIDKKILPLEVYRKDLTVGFGVRSPVLIPAGTPIMEFTGEICGYNKDSADYSFQITYEDQEQIKTLSEQLGFTDLYKDLIIELHQQTIFIDPKKYGNVARMACHSCSANMEIFRIFQKSLSPAHVRLIFVAMMDIYPGTPLTIDYGHDYVVDHFKGGCKCGTFVCTKSEDEMIFTTLSREEIAKCYQILDQNQWKSWDSTIYKTVWDERNRIEREKEERRLREAELIEMEENDELIVID
ncbi:unnamed protein product [Caenorhabditis brenneri]